MLTLTIKKDYTPPHKCSFVFELPAAAGCLWLLRSAAVPLAAVERVLHPAEQMSGLEDPAPY